MTTQTHEIEYQINVLNKGRKYVLYILMLLWLCTSTFAFLWWFQPRHINNAFLFTLNSLVIIWMYSLPAYFFFFVIRMKKPNPKLVLPKDWRVAMVVTKVPSESFALVTDTLTSMINQKYPHDTWLADENPQPEMVAWAKKNNVHISTRKDDANYNREHWPRRKKCKEGNLAYFYDYFGYDMYDFVIQLDADHIPQENYLENMLLPFLDDKVGYVTAPSICSKNAHSSWSARARLYAEGLLHGAQQAGHSNGFAPLCFGSHYAVRTKALKQIGGLGPELAEDHTTSMMMNSYGWRGVHALEAVAIGDGPATFADAMTQEFQWSRSLMNVFLIWTPIYFKNLKFAHKMQFLFSQLWYPAYAFTMLLGFTIPLLAIILDTPLVSVSYISFFIVNSLVMVSTLLVVLYLKWNKLLCPINAKVFSWELLLFQLARWPWVLFGILASLYGVILNKQFSIKVTPKDQTGYVPLSLQTIAPYLLLLGTYLFLGLYLSVEKTQGYYYFLITGCVMYLLTVFVIVVKHEYEQK